MLTETQILERVSSILETELLCRAPEELIDALADKEIFSMLYTVVDETADKEEDSQDQIFKEPLEFYLVSNWLGHKLSKLNEPVIKLSNVHLWGRCTSGQYIIDDGLIQKIVEGAENEN